MQSALVLTGYVAGGVLGLRLASFADAVTLVWPPTGVAVAAVVVYGRRMLPVIWVGALAVNLLAADSANATGAALIATGNTLEALVAGALLQRAAFFGSFESRREVAQYAVAAALLAPVAAAVTGATALVVTGALSQASWLSVASLWWAGDATGALIVGPLVLTWLRPARPIPWTRWVGALALVAAASSVAFAAPNVAAELRAGLLLAPTTALVWAALKLGPRGAATACALVCFLAVVGTEWVGGPLLGLTGAFAPAPLWLFITTAGVLSLLLTALNAERGSAEAATRLSQARFANAFDHAPIGMAILAHDGLLLDANPHMAQMLASTVGGVVGLNASTWLQDPLDTLGDATAAAGHLHPPPSVRVVDAAGNARTWNARLTALPLGDDEPALLLQAEDVTDARANEASLRALNEQLVHAQRMDSVGNLAGGIAHDFNNLLQAIGANVELARHPATNTAVRERALRGAGDAVERAATLTSRLLAFSHRSPVQRVPVDLNHALERSREMLVRLLPETIALTVRAAPEPAFALVDATQLDQVLMNLCVNSRDAMTTGGHIDLAIEVTERSVVITSTDDGPGVPAELRERVFEPFFTTKERGRGTGFGLSIVFGIVRAHDGEVRIEDGPSGGARFVITLPRTHQQPVATATPQQPAGHDRLHVLMAEDDPLVRDALLQMLESEGHHVTVAHDGADALTRYQGAADNVDVLLFDVRMPQMTGPAAMRAIRAQRRDIPAVLMSGYSGDELREDDADLASVELLEKPFELVELVQALTRATTREASGGAPVDA